jgi:hypothetical protein
MNLPVSTVGAIKAGNKLFDYFLPTCMITFLHQQDRNYLHKSGCKSICYYKFVGSKIFKCPNSSSILKVHSFNSNCRIAKFPALLGERELYWPLVTSNCSEKLSAVLYECKPLKIWEQILH